jgi:hypothetical protein
MSMFYSLPTLIQAEMKDAGLPMDFWIASKFTEQELCQLKDFHRRLGIGEYRDMFSELFAQESQIKRQRVHIAELRTKCHAPQVASAIAEIQIRVFDARKIVAAEGTEKDLQKFDSVVSEIISMEPHNLLED